MERFITSISFGALISVLVFVFAAQLMSLFIDASETAVISLGTRVALAYALSAIPVIGVVEIWWSVPIGWFLADAVGIIYYLIKKEQLLAALD